MQSDFIVPTSAFRPLPGSERDLTIGDAKPDYVSAELLPAGTGSLCGSRLPANFLNDVSGATKRARQSSPQSSQSNDRYSGLTRHGGRISERKRRLHVCSYIDSMAKVKSKSKPKILSSRVVYRGPVFSVTRDEVIEPSGVQARRDIIHHPGSVVIMAVDDSQPEPRVLLCRQYRHSAQDYLWELCAGSMDEGENELVAAKRELREETGYTAQSWKRILNFYASPGFLGETMSIYLARGLRPGKAQPEEDEVIETRFFSLSAAVRIVMRGKIRDAKTIAGVLWLQQKQSS